MRTLGGSDFVWAQVLETIRIDDQTISPGDVADVCSLLSVADRVLVANLAGAQRAACAMCSALTSLGFAVRSLTAATGIKRSDTVVVFAGPGVEDDDAGVVWPVVRSGAVLLVVTATTSPPPLRRADALVSIPVRLARYPRQREESFSRTAFDLMALIVVGAVECGLIELLARRDEHRHVN
jgi:DNA-binding MurR/RpiR family transcriptional regulator